MARFPDWLIYSSLTAAVVAIAIARNYADAPPAPPPGADEHLGALLAPATPFDPAVVVQAPDVPGQPASGTAFAISSRGLWLTARHVVEGCREAVLSVGGGSAVSARVQLARSSDVALLITEGGPPALPLASSRDRLRVGRHAYHPGYPQGRAGEAASRLLGRETLRIRGRGQRDEPVLAWAEIGRTEGLRGTLGGLSGGPALDGQGRVLAVTIAEAPRRGRIYTTAVESLTSTTRELGLASEYAPGAIINAGNYGSVADSLRRDLRVAQVVCLRG